MHCLCDFLLQLQGFYEVWGEGKTVHELRAAIEAFPKSRKQPWFSPAMSWRIKVDSWGQAISMQEQIDLINELACVPLQVRCHTGSRISSA